MCDTRRSPAPGRLADRSRRSYVKGNTRQVIMFTRFFRRIDGYRHLWGEIGALGQGRVAGVPIAYFGR